MTSASMVHGRASGLDDSGGVKPGLSVSILLALLGAGRAVAADPLPTVPEVDLARYQGKWFEIARLPNFFQRAGARATAEYSPRPDGSLTVCNTELRPDGSMKVAEGRATPVPGSGGARLRVRFRGLAALAPVPREGNYWILMLEPDYSLVLVGTPNRKLLWVLARDARVPAARVDRYVARARELGFPTEKLLRAKW